MPIDANSAVPMYRQLADLLRARIAGGELGDGDRLPSEAQLGETFGVSRITVRQALAELEQAGQLLRVPGKGSFVRARPPIEGLTRLSGFSESARAAGREAAYRVLRLGEEAAPDEVADRLRLADPRVVVVERVFLADGAPVGMHASYIPLWVARQAPPGALDREALARGSLYAAIEHGDVVLHRAEEWLEPGLADAELAERLGVEPGSLVQGVRLMVYDDRDRPVMFESVVFRPDAYAYRVEFFRTR